MGLKWSGRFFAKVHFLNAKHVHISDFSDTAACAGEWGCWFTSIYHHVEALKQGTRVVVVYNLMRVFDPPVNVIIHTPLDSNQELPDPVSNPCTSTCVRKVLFNPMLLWLITSYLNFRPAVSLQRVNKQLRDCLPKHCALSCGIRPLTKISGKLRRLGCVQLGFHLRHTYSFGAGGVCEPWQLKGCDR